MPQQTVYIRNGDMDKWKALENKAAFISEHLNGKKQSDTPYKGMPEVLDFENEKTKKLGNNLCNIHNTPLTLYGKCLMKGCKHA